MRLRTHKQQPPRESLSRRFLLCCCKYLQPGSGPHIRRAWCHNLAMSEPEASAQENEKYLQEFLQQQESVMREFVRMTPEEQEQSRLQMRAEGLKTFVSQAGLGEEVAQALLPFIAERDQARRRLCVLAEVLYLCESTKSKPGLNPSEARLAMLLEQYEAAAEAERARDQAAAQALDQAVGWSRSPRLRSFLLRSGLIGDALWLSHTDLMSPTGGGLSTGIVREWNEKQTLPPEFSWLLDGDDREAGGG